MWGVQGCEVCKTRYTGDYNPPRIATFQFGPKNGPSYHHSQSTEVCMSRIKFTGDDIIWLLASGQVLVGPPRQILHG
jgi:hypothetical protein